MQREGHAVSDAVQARRGIRDFHDHAPEAHAAKRPDRQTAVLACRTYMDAPGMPSLHSIATKR